MIQNDCVSTSSIESSLKSRRICLLKIQMIFGNFLGTAPRCAQQREGQRISLRFNGEGAPALFSTDPSGTYSRFFLCSEDFSHELVRGVSKSQIDSRHATSLLEGNYLEYPTVLSMSISENVLKLARAFYLNLLVEGR